ncbi:MAG: radical SAM family heme chaperone HemW [Oscillospiraceae bacterium]|nr:radical SAM family heme chaperone HemW [Oscillospiraceae bacterium]
MSKAGIYIHIPFCSGKCFYCDFYSGPASHDAMDAYTRALCAHIASTTGAPQADTVYFGGGTPSYLGPENLIRILGAVRGAFSLESGAQITLEANPGDICVQAGMPDDAEKALSRLREAGFDRISFGVQSAHDAELSMLGRRHSFRQAEKAVESAKKAGFSDISLDLMYALPGQTMDAWLASVDAVLSLAPTHISCYALTLSPASRLNALSSSIPDEDVQSEMYLAMVQKLADAGFAQYEISNFARPGFFSRHNVKYWTRAPYFAFGPSAHGFDGSVRYAWADDTAAYIRGEYRYKEYIPLSFRDRAEEALMLSLRMTQGIELASYARAFSQEEGDFAKILNKYVPAGFVLHEGGRYALTPKGMFVSDYILAELFGAIKERNA